jgi:hypothetical protein
VDQWRVKTGVEKWEEGHESEPAKGARHMGVAVASGIACRTYTRLKRLSFWDKR